MKRKQKKGKTEGYEYRDPEDLLSGIFHNLIIQEIAIRLSNDNDV